MLHKLKLTTEGQTLTSESLKLASGLVEEIECEFELDSSWEGFDYLRALFTDNYGDCIEKTLVNGKCNVPQECLSRKGWCKVNLCAYDVVSQQKVLQQTSYMTKIADITQEVAVNGTNTQAPTTQVWEQELLAHTSNTTVHTTAQEKATWNGKSVVSASSTGTATDEVKYITIDGVEKKLPSGGSGGSVSWNDVTDKPSTFPPSPHTQAWSTITDKPESYPPSSHTHDDRYYTETETDTLLNNKVDKVDGKGLSTNDYTDADKQKVANAITEHQSLANYYNKSETDSAISAHHDSSKQDELVSGTNIKTINNNSILGSGNLVISGGYESDYELIETIVLTEDTNEITRTQDTEGVPYDFSKMLLVIEFNPRLNAEEFGIINHICTNPSTLVSAYCYRSASIQYIVVSYEILNGRLFVDGASGYDDGINPYSMRISPTGGGAFETSAITRMRLYANIYPAGTTISIYAIRK